MEDIIIIVKSLEDFNLLRKGVTRTIKNDTKEPRSVLFYMLLGTLEASSMANILADKRVITKRQGRCVCVYWAGNGTVQTGAEVIRAGNGIMKAGQDFWFHFFLWIILKYKGITKMNLNSKLFMHKTISQKLWRMWHTK